MHLLKFTRRITGLFLALLLTSSVYSASLKSAKITAIVNDVSVLSSGQNAKPAQLDETISGQSSVQTGLKSRAELLFSDKTMARLGANSTFSFTNGTRDIDLKQGTMLLQVPKGAGGAKITTEAVTCAITGTTIMIEYFPGGFTKVIVLEGTLRLFLNNRVGESTLLGPGKMVILNPNAKEIPEPVDVDIKRLVKTSKLIQAIDGTDMDLKIVENEIADQEKQKKEGDLIGTNLVITGSGTEVILASEDLLNALQNAAPEQKKELAKNDNDSGDATNPPFSPPSDVPTPPSPPTPPVPTKYNPVVTITGPNPYVINNTTSIVTDPTITTNGVTNQGTIYNSTAQSGTTSDFMFGSTKPFDAASSFNTSFLGEDYTVFRFKDLKIQSTPTIDTTGGPKNLFLVSKKDIDISDDSEVVVTSFSEVPTPTPSTPVDFSALDSLTLATQTGTITISKDVIGPQSELYLYSAELVVDSPITMGSSDASIIATAVGIGIHNTVSAKNITLDFTNFLSFYPEGQLKADDIQIAGGSDGTMYFKTSSLNPSVSLNLSGFSIGFEDPTTFSSGLDITITATGGLAFYADFNAPSAVLFGSQNVDCLGSLTVRSIESLGTVTTAFDTDGDPIGGSITTSQFIKAAGDIDVRTFISAGGLLQGGTITAGSDITAGNIKSTVGDIISTGDSITSTIGGIVSAGNISAKTGINSAGDITANGNLGTTDTGSQTTAQGKIIASFLIGPTSAGTTTFKASTSIYANAIASSAGTVLLRSPSISLVDATEGITNIDSFQLDDPSDRTLQNLLIYTDGESSLAVTMSGDVGSAANPITNITTDTQVNWIGATHNFYADEVGTGSITAKDLFVKSLDVSGGSLTVNTINRTHLRNADHVITVGGDLAVTSGILFDGASGTSAEDGGVLILSAPNIIFGTGINSISGATANGGNGSGSTPGGKGGILGITSTSNSGNITLFSGANITANGGNSASGAAGIGGTIGMTTSSESLQSINVQNLLSASGGTGRSGGAGGNISLTSNYLDFTNSTVTANGGNASSGSGGNGGYITVTSTGVFTEVSMNSANFNAVGGNSANGQGGNGSQIQITTSGSGSFIGVDGNLNANGGSTGLNNGQGGNGGTIDLVTTGNASEVSPDIFINSTSTLSAIGGNSNTGNGTGGNGGNINLSSTHGDVTVNSSAIVSATTGLNSGSTTAGGNGGTIQVTAGKHANVQGVLTASSNDVSGKRVSNGPGNITITSHQTNTAQPGITIANTSQLLALLNAAAPAGSGGTIKFQSSGGKISLAGTVQADKGTIYAVNNAANGKIDIANTASLRADVIKAEVLGTNGTLTINGGGAGGLTADSQIKLMANQSTGTVLFTGGVINLTAPTILVNAHTVTVTNDTRVNNNGATTVGAVNHNYTNGVGPTGFGGFRDTVTQTAP